jgi:hypothetical protein
MKKYSAILLLLLVLGLTTGCKEKTYFKEGSQAFGSVTVEACAEFTTKNPYLVRVLETYVGPLQEGHCLTDATGSFDDAFSCSFESAPTSYLPQGITIDIPFTIYFDSSIASDQSMVDKLEQTCTQGGGTFEAGS